MRILLPVYFLLFVLSACNKNSDTDGDFYFGGVVINPYDNWVYLYQDEKVVDSVALNKDKTFLFHLKGKSPGLYRFVVKPEYQYVFFEPGDSLMVYLNTLDFDESLVFSGNGNEKNNFLTDIFLQNEKETDKIVSYYQLPANAFVRKMDSLRAVKKSALNKLKNEIGVSGRFEKVALAGINFINFRARELYPFVNTSHVETSSLNLPDGYYDYRKEVDMDDTVLMSYYSYKKYLVSYMNNVSYFKCLTDCKTQPVSTKFSLHHNLHKLSLIDSLTANPSIKDMLLQDSAVSFLVNEEDSTSVSEFMGRFDKIIRNREIKNDIDALAKNVLKISKGSMLPEIWVVNAKGETVNLTQLLKGHEAVICFWDSNLIGHFKNEHEKIATLKQKFPNIKFMAISTSVNHNQWLDELTYNKLDPENEFRALDFKKLSEDLVIKNITRTFLVKSDGTIKDASLNLFDPAFEAYLK